MNAVDEIRKLMPKYRHSLTPDQAIKLDEAVIGSKDHSVEPSTDQEVGQHIFGDPDWYSRQSGNDPTLKPLYPAESDVHSQPDAPSQSSGEGKI